ncbi:hypothetical protein SAMN05428969_2605 [Devosia sp. YR412]|uniref:hypothetical protein n=1 Tax=Devosia sp. YR412 TaxID=1881030 RepID=UPI0008D01B6F|nr:hypothetical protein [Devosia sp. YR412]SEQ29683.1 hypothetical protein SAMN05428969_2605 [Devosia sp. YR412]
MAEVLSVVAGIERPMKAREVAAFLGTRAGNIRNLATNGFLSSPTTDQLPAGLTHVFDRAQIEDFHRTYVSKTALKKDLVSGFEFGVLIGRGLEPASTWVSRRKKGRTIFYRRSEVEKRRT